MSAGKPPAIGLGQRLLAAAQQDRSWVIRLDDETEHTLTTAEVVEAYNDCRIDPETYVYGDGMQTWQQLQAVDALVDALHAEAERQGAAQDQPTESSNIKSGTDDSAIFSLATLVGDGAPTSMAAAAVTDEDSGLIDLTALAASASDSSPSADDGVAGGDLFQVLSAPPILEPPSPQSQRTRRKDRPLIVGLAVAAALLAAALVFTIVRSQGGEEVATPAPVVPTTTTVADSAPAPTSDEQPAPARSLAEGAEGETPPAVSSQVASSKGPYAGRVKPRTSARTKEPGPAVSATSTGPAKRICPVTDLMCNMRSATDGS